MTRPRSGTSKKVTAETLVGLGAERLADILVGVAETRPDLKRRLRMELAAEEGPSALAPEIDKRLNAFETSRGQVTWRQKPAVLRDLDALRGLIADRLAALDRFAAAERLWRFMDTARQVSTRLRDRDGALDILFERAAVDLGRLIGALDPAPAAARLVESLALNPIGWKAWLPALLAEAPPAIAERALYFMCERRGAVPGWISLLRQLADAAGDVDAFASTYSAEALRAPSVAAEVAQRYLAANQIETAGDILRAAAPKLQPRGRPPPPDDAWEGAWIDYLERADRAAEAQAVRWATFERTLSAERVRAFIGRLDDFDDVEAEARAFEIAAVHPDFGRGLRFLMEWPALAEAARMLERRGDEVAIGPEEAELWAAKLRRRYPQAAHRLWRSAAAAAFRRREFKLCDRLTAEAETISL